LFDQRPLVVYGKAVDDRGALTVEAGKIEVLGGKDSGAFFGGPCNISGVNFSPFSLPSNFEESGFCWSYRNSLYHKELQRPDSWKTEGGMTIKIQSGSFTQKI
jgi:hypothetical protein